MARTYAFATLIFSELLRVHIRLDQKHFLICAKTWFLFK